MSSAWYFPSAPLPIPTCIPPPLSKQWLPIIFFKGRNLSFHLSWLQHNQSHRNETLEGIPRRMSGGKEEMRPFLWCGMMCYLGVWAMCSFANVKGRQASVNHPTPVSQGLIPTIAFRVPSPIEKLVSQFSGAAQCQSFSRALWLGRFPYSKFLPSFCRLSIFLL